MATFRNTGNGLRWPVSKLVTPRTLEHHATSVLVGQRCTLASFNCVLIENTGITEISGQVTFEVYDGAPIEYEPSLMDITSPQYVWWENIILPVVSKAS